MYNSSIQPKADISAFYSGSDKLNLPINVYLPKNFKAGKKYKTVIAIHGGSWHGIMHSLGRWDGGMLAHTAKYYSNMGYVGITFSYRDILFSPSVTVEDLLYDCRNALEYIKNNFDFINKENIVFVGESAGGHLCLCLTMGLGNIVTPIMPKKLIAYNPVTDCTIKRWQHISDCKEHLLTYSPLFNPKKLLCNITIAHGTADEIVPLTDSIKFCHLMNEYGTSASLLEIPDGTHSFALFNYKNTDKYVCNIYNKINELCLL